MNGSELRVGGTLFLDGFYAEGEICLSGARIEGDLDCRNARLENHSGRSINAYQLVLGGELRCDHLSSDGEMYLEEAQVTLLRATGARISSSTTFALNAKRLRAKAGVYLDRGFRATASVCVAWANVTWVLERTDGVFENPDGRALDAELIVVDDIYLDRGFLAYGEVRFTHARVSRQFNATEGTFRKGHDGDALDLAALRCGGTVSLNKGFHANGTVRLTGAEAGELVCTYGSFVSKGGDALEADGMTCQGMVNLDRGFRAFGKVRLAQAVISGQIVCTEGLFDNKNGVALDFTGLKSERDVLLNSHFTVTGDIIMINAAIAGDLDFTGARLHGLQIDASGIHVRGRLIWTLDRPPIGAVDFSYAQIGHLDDTPQSWASSRYTLTAMNCQTPSNRMTADQRVFWLANAAKYPGDAIYGNLTQSYRLSASDRAARKIAIAGHRDLRNRGGLSPTSSAWNWFLDTTVGYGYRLHRPFLFLLVLMLISYGFYRWGEAAQLIYSTQASHMLVAPSCSVGYPCFSPYTYALQLLIPAIDLRAASYWFPNAAIKPWGTLLAAYTYLMIAIGWGVILALIPGVSRYFRGR